MEADEAMLGFAEEAGTGDADLATLDKKAASAFSALRLSRDPVRKRSAWRHPRTHRWSTGQSDLHRHRKHAALIEHSRGNVLCNISGNLRGYHTLANCHF
jgi:hypothetical protein